MFCVYDSSQVYKFREIIGAVVIHPVAVNVKPERSGAGDSGNPLEFDCDVYPQGGDFDRTSCI